VGEGRGQVSSERLYIEDCWDGPFRLNPTFFGANPYRDSLLIRIQRGDDIREVSDGLVVMVDDVSLIRENHLGEPLLVGLPPGVSPPGAPVPDPLLPSVSEAPRVSLALYLHNSCHSQNGTVYSIGGSIVFDALFSADPNESNADDRFTDAHFEVEFADPRDRTSQGIANASAVTGEFSFFFQRGQPAQPFP
jgi:hypothetical protein